MTDTSDTTPEPDAPFSEWEMKAAARTKLEAELFTHNKAALLNALALAGVTHVVVSFDGYGDEGQIQNVEVKAGDDDAAISARSTLADPMCYALARCSGWTCFLHDGRTELDTNPVERAIRPVHSNVRIICSQVAIAAASDGRSSAHSSRPAN